MLGFLNTDEKNEAVEKLLALLSTDADRLFSAMERAIVRNTLTEEGSACMQTEQRAVTSFAKSVLERLALLETRLPERHSLFRDREDSVRMYRAIIPFLSALDEQIKRFRAAILSLSMLRERVLRANMELMRLEWYCRALLQHKEASIYRVVFEQLLSQAVQSVKRQRELATEIEKRSTAWRSFDCDVILPFLEKMRTCSDAKHGGVACDCTGVVVLLGELKRETGKLI